jgi:hypothetical protein
MFTSSYLLLFRLFTSKPHVDLTSRIFFYIANLSATGKSCYVIKGKPFLAWRFLSKQDLTKSEINTSKERTDIFYLLNTYEEIFVVVDSNIRNNESIRPGCHALLFFGLPLFSVINKT